MGVDVGVGIVLVRDVGVGKARSAVVVAARDSALFEVPSGNELDQKGAEEGHQRDTKGVGVDLPSFTETRGGEALVGGLEEMDEGGRDDDAGAKVLCAEEDVGVDVKTVPATGEDGEEGAKGAGSEDDEDGGDAGAQVAVELVVGGTAAAVDDGVGVGGGGVVAGKEQVLIDEINSGGEDVIRHCEEKRRRKKKKKEEEKKRKRKKKKDVY